MPAEQRVGRDDRRDVAQQATAQPVGQCREPPPIGISETQSPATQLPPEQAILFDQLGEHLPFATIEPGQTVTSNNWSAETSITGASLHRQTAKSDADHAS
jgi:hypothetical protein